MQWITNVYTSVLPLPLVNKRQAGRHSGDNFQVRFWDHWVHNSSRTLAARLGPVSRRLPTQGLPQTADESCAECLEKRLNLSPEVEIEQRDAWIATNTRCRDEPDSLVTDYSPQEQPQATAGKAASKD